MLGPGRHLTTRWGRAGGEQREAAGCEGQGARGDSQEEVDGLLCTGPMTMWQTDRKQDSKPYESKDSDWEAGIVSYISE